MTSTGSAVREDAGGKPVWSFRVTETLLQTNRRIAFPEAVATHLGCKPGVLTRVTVEDPAGCRKLKVCLEQGDPPRTVVLNLAEPLTRIGILDGQLIDLVVTARHQVALRPSQKPNRPEPDTKLDVLPSRGSASPQGTQPGPLSRWGATPTPLLPRWYFDAHGNEMVPAEFISVYPSVRRIRDLKRFWQFSDEPLDQSVVWALRDMAARLMPPPQLRILGPNFGIDALDRLPLMNRTRNCVRRGLQRGSLADGTIAELMRLPSFGIASLLDLMCVLEAAHEHGLDVSARPAPAAGPTYDVTAEPVTVAPDDSSPRATAAGWPSDTTQLIAVAARELRGAATVGDLLRLDLSDLIAAAGADAALDEFPLETDHSTVADLAVETVAACMELMSETQRMVVLGRLATSSPTTLQQLADKAGLSRERIRQLDRQATEALEEAAGPSLGLLALAASERLGDVTTKPEIEEMVVALLPQPRQVDCVDSPVVARWALFARLGYACRDHLCLSAKAVEAAKTLKETGTRLTDDAGLIDIEQCRQVVPPELHDDLDALVRWVGWHRLSEHVAPRATARARVKAALLKIGAPATKAELAQEGGMTERQVGGALSSIASVARATKDRWGLREWIDDIYEGIPAEIIQRINEDGGSTRLNRVLDELPRLFNVSESSVWAYLNTPAFRVEHGWVTEATESDFQVGPLVDVVDGFTDEGDPYWTLEVAQRYLRGYSLHGVPPEIALALGCTFGDRTTVPVLYPDSCQDISVIWRKTSMHGPEIGRLSDALQALGTQDATPVRLIIHKGRPCVSFRPPENPRKATPATRDQHGVRPDAAVPGKFAGVRTAAPIRGGFDGQPSEPGPTVSRSETLQPDVAGSTHSVGSQE
ncbi:MAG: hypothetical protein F4110_01275 [Acidimicrobiaceae bacterium]|nr:hypothetical protein [Acidimicrobiaceae bacterium]MXZ97948.1 hypothetical protein [Acidimicrobiaceae bacterium]MYE77231.1 hypothetical protein [Acidimicrobiaceae bacterium]MYE95853.1 hypothetical protein [Acidimicrobiaceae bacterium]MYH43255.1 hypothetical protein [Acidimicrobiaceae bacterium]